MMKYRKKPVVIEAMQLRWDNWNEMCGFLGNQFFESGGTGARGKMKPNNVETINLRIPTLEGEMLAIENDWIIRGIKGELYPCKPDIFEATYEPVEEPTESP